MSDTWGAETRELFTCGHCGTHGEGGVVGEYSIPGGDPDANEWWNTRYATMRCEYCKQPTIMRETRRDDDSMIWVEGRTQLYPNEARGQSAAIPESIRSAMAEAHLCIRAHAPTAAALMVRRSLEALAVDRAVTTRNLAASIHELRDGGHIDQRLFDWADALRLAGNSAAHDVDRSADPIDVRDMIHLAEAILDYVYVIQARYEQFRARRLSSSPSPPQA